MAELCPSENPGDRKILVTKLLATYGTITAFEGAMLWLILVTVTFRLSPGCYPVLHPKSETRGGRKTGDIYRP
jgi:hypothetical protein